MARRVFLWLAVSSLCGLALATAGSALVFLAPQFGGPGWTAYTPSSMSAPTFAMRMVELSSYAEMVLVPVAALSSAVYIVLLDRAVARVGVSHGFEVGSTSPGGGEARANAAQSPPQ